MPQLHLFSARSCLFFNPHSHLFLPFIFVPDSHCFCPVLNADVKAVLPCIRKRRSVFPKNYSRRDVLPQTMQSLLDAALWAPYHGRSSTKSPPGRFVVLGKKSMVAMQQLTLKFYGMRVRPCVQCLCTSFVSIDFVFLACGYRRKIL